MELKPINIKKIISEYDTNTDSEIKKVTEIGTKIADALREHPWTTWTKFPAKFNSVRCDSDLYEALDSFGKWLKAVGIDKTVLQDETKDQLLETKEPVEPVEPKEPTPLSQAERNELRELFKDINLDL